MADLIYPKLSYKVVGCCFTVYNTLGPFYREQVHQRALEIELERQGMHFESKVPVPLRYAGDEIATYQLDVVVDKRLILELKAVDFVHPQHVSQLVQYLALTELKLGLVINFGDTERLYFRRVPFEPANHANHANSIGARMTSVCSIPS